MSERDPWMIEADAAAARIVVPVIEESVGIGRRTDITGRIRIDLRTEIVNEPVETTLDTTEMRVERREINRMLEPGEPAPQQSHTGATTIIPVIEEVLVVEKRLMLRAELHVTAITKQEAITTIVPLRKQTAEVTHLDAEDMTNDPAPDRSSDRSSL